jgi:hypothetical protein
MSGKPQSEVIALAAIQMIEREAHRSGLTDRVQAYLKEKTGRDVHPTDDHEVGSDPAGGGNQTSVIRSNVRRDPSELGGFRSGGFRKGGFRNTNAPSEPTNDSADNSKPEESQ